MFASAKLEQPAATAQQQPEIKVQLMKPEAASPNEAVCIEVIRAELWKFGKPDATVDFDVNNLELKRADDVRLT